MKSQMSTMPHPNTRSTNVLLMNRPSFADGEKSGTGKTLLEQRLLSMDGDPWTL
jgi:hypothetical protein